MRLVLINVVLAFTWAAVAGSFTLLNVLFGFLLGGLALSLIREQAGAPNYFRRALMVMQLVIIFLSELVQSSVRVAAIVLAPKRDLAPAIVAYPLDVESDFQITILANLITLTPGTLSLDVSEDGRTLYIHCIDVPDTDAAIADIKLTFERRIMETFAP
jgi:multicomponent Na+:H+ antiporter subunit E